MRTALLVLLLSLFSLTGVQAQTTTINPKNIKLGSNGVMIDTGAATPTATYPDGSIWLKEDGTLWCRSGSTWGLCIGGSGAPTAAGYWVKTSDATLSNEVAMSSFDSGFVINTTTTGVPTIYGGDTCPASQFVTALSTSGVLTCGTPSSSMTGPGSSIDNALVRWNGSGGDTLQNSAIVLEDTGIFTFPDNIRQTFNPGTISAGFNVGSMAGNPSTLVNGDLWYNSSTSQLNARINGSTVALGAGGGGGIAPSGSDGDIQIRSSSTLAAYAGTTPCTNAFITALDTAGAATCGTTLATPSSATDAANKQYVDEQIAAAIPASTAQQNSFLVTGGQVVWESGFQFRVSAATYYIAGTQYQSAEQTVTLDAADVTDDRIDVIVLTSSGTADKVTGTAAAATSEPSIDVSTQLKLVLVSVPAASSAPPGISNTLVYAENVGGPTEWNWTTSGSGFNVNSTTNPKTGTKDIEGTTVANGAYAQAAIPSGTLDLTTVSQVTLFIRSKATWNSGRALTIGWYSSGVLRGNLVTLGQGSYGFSSSNTGAYQQIAIPASHFAVPTGFSVNQLRIIDSGGSIGFYIDDINLQLGSSVITSTGLTQAQADVRYLKQTSNLSDVAAAATARTNISAAASGAVTGSGLTMATARLLGRSTASTGAIEEVTVGSGLTLSGGTLTSSGTGADVSGYYFVSRATSAPVNAVNFGALTTGMLKHTVSGSVSTPATAAAGTDYVAPGAFTSSGLTMATARLLGRTTASTGAAEEITVGSGLTLSAGTLTASASAQDFSIGLTVDGGGSTITTGVKGFIVAPTGGTIVSATLLSTDAAATACSIVFDVWKDTYANYPPDNSDSITASAPPTLSTANKSQDSTLTGWTTTVTAGQVYGFTVDSVTACTRVTLMLKVTP